LLQTQKYFKSCFLHSKLTFTMVQCCKCNNVWMEAPHSGKAAMSNEPTRIRRYPNRRFYDRTRRRYITLGDIEELVLGGATIEVEDSRTGEDLTRQILTQILLERHPEKIDVFPAALLQGLLRANELALDLWRSYLRYTQQAMEGFQRPTPPLGLPLPWLSAFLPGWMGAAPASAEDRQSSATRLTALEARIAGLEAGAGLTGGAERDDGTDVLDRLERRVRRLEDSSST
jgi:polyhydroxyalkanoate synthesis repressor PhaR